MVHPTIREKGALSGILAIISGEHLGAYRCGLPIFIHLEVWTDGLMNGSDHFGDRGCSFLIFAERQYRGKWWESLFDREIGKRNWTRVSRISTNMKPIVESRWRRLKMLAENRWWFSRPTVTSTHIEPRHRTISFHYLSFTSFDRARRRNTIVFNFKEDLSYHKETSRNRYSEASKLTLSYFTDRRVYPTIRLVFLLCCHKSCLSTVCANLAIYMYVTVRWLEIADLHSVFSRSVDLR